MGMVERIGIGHSTDPPASGSRPRKSPQDGIPPQGRGEGVEIHEPNANSMSSSLNPSRSFHSSIHVRPGCVHQSIQSNSRLVQIQVDEGIDANGRVGIGRGSGV